MQLKPARRGYQRWRAKAQNRNNNGDKIDRAKVHHGNSPSVEQLDDSFFEFPASIEHAYRGGK